MRFGQTLGMQEHRIIFRFEGREADRHRLDASDRLAYETGARQLLATHAYFLVNQKVPNGGAQSRGPGYHVYSLDPRQACFEGHWIVEVAEVLFKEALKSADGHAVRKAVAYTYDYLLKDSLGAILGGKSSSMPLEMRQEPVLPGLDTRNEPVFDVEFERDRNWRQLRERSILITPNAFRPVARSSERLTIIVDDVVIGRVDEDKLRRLIREALTLQAEQERLQAQITDALAT
jgi:hypothetical protein